ncbi:MAG: TolC family protein [Bacteroidota bacterium]
MKKIIFIVLLLTSFKSLAQSDSVTILSVDTFLYYVKNFHPLAKQAALKLQEGQSTLLSARGNFDPKINVGYDEKYYQQKEYYQYTNTTLSIPTWAGIDLKAGYNNSYGDYINPEYKTPGAGLYQAGISVPLLQGLLFDQRRNAFRQAELYEKATSEERRIILNELQLDAGNTYWNWYQSYQNWKLYSEVYAVNKKRVEAIKSSALLGDRPFLDTVEATVQLQERFLNLEQAHLDYLKRSYEVSGFLWNSENIPLLIGENTIPSNEVTLSTNVINVATTEEIMEQHPQINLANYKISSLEFEKRWKQEQLKPTLNVNYNALNYATTNGEALTYNLNNYKWGFAFSVPLLLRKERGGVQLAKIKLKDAELDRERKITLLKNKIAASKEEIISLDKQLTFYQETVIGYQQLLNAENTLFDTGESSLFLVNSRESNLVNAKLKLVDLKAKLKKAVLMYQYNLGEM